MRWLDEQRRRRARARELFADPALGLEARARGVWRGGFSSGAEWMRGALAAIRGGEKPRGETAFARLGCVKYAACGGVAAVAMGVAAWLGAGAAVTGLSAVIAFYVVEAQLVFLFPVALDRGVADWRGARRLMRDDGGTPRAVATVLPIAFRMVTGGWRGWCRGCLEVLLWYEDARRVAGTKRSGDFIVGAAGALERRIERIAVRGVTRRTRVAWVSDLHLVRRGTIATVRAVLVAVRELRPDVIVLGGDLVDGTAGLGQLARLIRALTRVAPVWALPGNHDERFGIGRVAATVRAAGGAWLPGVSAPIADGEIHLVAGERGPEATLPSRGVVIACLHAPAHAMRWKGTARVVLAGHLHGGQFVAARAFGRFWPCAFFYRWCGPRFEFPAETTLIVGCGAGDLLPVRWRCPREVVAVDLVPAGDNTAQSTNAAA